MNAAPPPVPGESSIPQRRRKPNNLLKLSRSPYVGRSALVNHFNRKVDALRQVTKFPRISAFGPSNIVPWIRNYLKYVFERKYPFPSYHAENYTGVYRITPSPGSDTIRMGIAGDWATGTDESHRIADLIQSASPNFTIHLGDVYYVGDTEEIEQNCLGESHHGYDGVKWPKGTQGSFALNGNHEMYANGKPYFEQLLPKLGVKGDAEGQVASFFCLETDRWRIVAIDTGYNSVGIPILSMIPWINEIPFIGGDCHLQRELIEWLRDVVQLKQNPKPLLLLSHHQFFSAFTERDYPKPAEQLAEFLQGQEG